MNTQDLSRREFIKKASQYGLIFGGASLVLSNSIMSRTLSSDKVNSFIDTIIEEAILQNAPLARYWVSTSTKNVNCINCHTAKEISKNKTYKHDEEIIKCLLCAQGCLIKNGERGKCRARMNINGELRSLVYGHPVAVHVDPIEKKPLYHFMPGAEAYSLATAGCPLSCKFCQNWEISQAKPEDFSTKFIPPESVVESTLTKKIPIIAFTYNEPTVFTEYLIDIAKVANKKNIKSVLISCGFMNQEPLAEMCDVLSAIKIDLKGFSEDFYRNVSGAELKPVLRSIKQIARTKTHLEIVNLVVPTLNDSDKMLNSLAEWIIGEIGPDVPLHFTRFHPDYKLLNLSPTPIATLERARHIAMNKGIHYVYIGNVPGHAGNNTYCPFCKKEIIRRTNFFVLEEHITNGRCDYCKNSIAGVWE
ncbi:MAG: AmmeMemoRadiSam system radical SAM enzyme [Bacteroidetes bacterium]|nr:AmmeMemoRadiSam system radical SAM enzyme [Bacteroidota bacterium]